MFVLERLSDAKARDAELAARDARRAALQSECNATLALQVAERKKGAIRTAAEERALVQLEADKAAKALAAEQDEIRRRKAFDASYRQQLAHQVKTDRVRALPRLFQRMLPSGAALALAASVHARTEMRQRLFCSVCSCCHRVGLLKISRCHFH